MLLYWLCLGIMNDINTTDTTQSFKHNNKAECVIASHLRDVITKENIKTTHAVL